MNTILNNLGNAASKNQQQQQQRQGTTYILSRTSIIQSLSTSAEKVAEEHHSNMSSSNSAETNNLIISISNSILRIALNCKELQSTSLQSGNNKIQSLVDETKSLIQNAKFTDLKRLLELSNNSPSVKMTQKKLAKDFDQVAQQFSEIQRVVLQRSKDLNVGTSYQTTSDDDNQEDMMSETAPLLQNKVKKFDSALDTQIDLNEKIIVEREEDLVGLERSIAEVNEIFRDLGMLVNDQQYLLDNIENNVNNVSVHMEGATSELRQASNYQNSTGKTYMWIFLVLLILAIVVILSMQPWKWGK